MALPFTNSQSKKRPQIIAVDLGSRTTKAVSLIRKGNGYALSRYVIQDAPGYEKGFSRDILGPHLKAVTDQLDSKIKQVTLAIGVSDSLLRNTELPQLPISEMRLMLKFNSKTYLQQELPDHVFDCSIVPPKPGPKSDAKAPANNKFKVWVGGARSSVIEELQAAVRNAGLLPDQVTLGVLGPVNAFEMAHPEIFQKEVVALVDIGFKNSTISVLAEGELLLSRVVGIAGDRITTGLSEAMGISYAEAEGIKVGMPTEVEGTLQPLLSPLGRELRASIDFFEHQQDKTVSQVFVSGGSARSDFIIQSLQMELMVPCKVWNPASFLQMALPPQQIGELEHIAPQLAVAVGAAVPIF